MYTCWEIRGIVEKDFPQEVVYNLGRAFGTYVKNKGKSYVLVSGDIRFTTPKLKEWFSNGLLTCGINVIDAGIIPTPTNYFSMFNFNIDASVQITGSHNPPEFNGFKFSHNKRPFYGDQIQKIKSHAH